ncbi:MAG: hypothetical protein ACI959_001309, partial [Limisphaerales bacterium]
RVAWGINNSALFLKTLRIQQLTILESGETRYYTSDEFWGILTPIVKLFYGKKVQNGFDRVAADLKHYCESN